jgi:putative membrane protein
MSWTSWEIAPPPLAAAGVVLAAFAYGFFRLRRRTGSRHADGWRVPLILVAAALATLPLISPLDHAGDDYLLSAHMLQHVLLGDAAPALALVALRGPLLLFVVPAPLLRLVGHQQILRRTQSFLFRPPVTIAIWAVVIGAWHVPTAYDYALDHPAVHEAEHLSFLVVGLLMWTLLIDPPRSLGLGPSQQLRCAVAMLVFAFVLGGLLVAAPPLYPAYAREPIRLFGIGPTLDQHLAGLVMIVEQVASITLWYVFFLPRFRRQTVVKTTLRTSADRFSQAVARTQGNR